MIFRTKQTTLRFDLLLTWTIFNLCLDLAPALCPTYFAGDRGHFLSCDCSAEEHALCDRLCPDNVCLDFSLKKTICYCHEVNKAEATKAPCKFVATTPPGSNGERDTSTTDVDRFCTDFTQDDSRSKIDVYACQDGESKTCVLKDYLEEIQTEGQFGGKSVEVDCSLSAENACKDFCPSTSYASCQLNFYGWFMTYLQCFCHSPPTDAQGYTCSKTETITSTSAKITDADGIPDECHNSAIDGGFTEEVDLYTCTKGSRILCILVEPTPPTTTTAPATLGGLKVSCGVCESDGSLLSGLVCSILCTVSQVINVVKALLSDILEVINRLFNLIPSVLGSVIDAIGDLST